MNELRETKEESECEAYARIAVFPSVSMDPSVDHCGSIGAPWVLRQYGGSVSQNSGSKHGFPFAVIALFGSHRHIHIGSWSGSINGIDNPFRGPEK